MEIDDVRSRLVVLQGEAAGVVDERAVTVDLLMRANIRDRAAQARLDRATTLHAAADARQAQAAAREEIRLLTAAGTALATKAAAIGGEIELLQQQLDDAGRFPADASDPPWHIGPGAAGRTGIYDAAGRFVAETQQAADARLIVNIINRAARLVAIDAGAGDAGQQEETVGKQ